MYVPATDKRCSLVRAPYGATMSTNNGAFMQDGAGVGFIDISPGSDSTDRSVCHRALVALSQVNHGREPTPAELKDDLLRLYVFVPSKAGGLTILHLRDVVPDRDWPRSTSIIDARNPRFVFMANSAMIKNTAVLATLRASTPLSKPDLVDFRLHIVEETSRDFSRVHKEIQSTVDRARKALTLKHLSDDMFGKLDDESWWRKFSPKLATFEKSKRRWVASKIHGAGSGTAHWLGKHLARTDVRTMVDGVDWMIGAQKAMIEAVLGNYFKDHDAILPVQMNMDLSLQSLDNNTAARQGLKMAVMTKAVAGSGPFIIKIFQQLSAVSQKRSGLSARACMPAEKWMQNGIDINPGADINLEELTSSVFSAIPPMTAPEIKLLREKMSANPYFGKMESGTLGSASLAEAHLVKGAGPKGEDVVLKFLRVQYAFYFLCEVDFMLRIVWREIALAISETLPELSPLQRSRMVQQSRQLLLFLVVEFGQEFDYAQEFANMERGVQIYTVPKDNIFSAKGISFDTKTIPFIVQSFVPGRSLSEQMEWADNLSPASLRESELAKIFKLQTNFYRVWLRNTLAGTGEFHADAHGGNLRITPDGTQLFVIDYGSFGTLTKVDRCRLIDAVLASTRIDSMTDLVSGDSLQLLASLLLAPRFLKGLSPQDIRAAITALSSNRHPNLSAPGHRISPDDVAQMLAEATQELPVSECVRRASLRSIFVEARFNHDTTAAKLAKMLHAALGEVLSAPLSQVVLTFREFPTMLPTQRRILLSTLKSHEKSVVKKHSNNVRHMMVFMRRLDLACEVKSPSSDERIERIATSMLHYGADVNFGVLFMEYILQADEVGTCTSSAVTLFGRAIAYVSGMNAVIWSSCGNEKLCPTVGMTPLLRGAFLKSPALILQILRWVRSDDPSSKCG